MYERSKNFLRLASFKYVQGFSYQNHHHNFRLIRNHFQISSNHWRTYLRCVSSGKGNHLNLTHCCCSYWRGCYCSDWGHLVRTVRQRDCLGGGASRDHWWNHSACDHYWERCAAKVVADGIRERQGLQLLRLEANVAGLPSVLGLSGVARLPMTNGDLTGQAIRYWLELFRHWRSNELAKYTLVRTWPLTTRWWSGTLLDSTNTNLGRPL